jgi:membrane protease YdiL (CAAX protease family)
VNTVVVDGEGSSLERRDRPVDVFVVLAAVLWFVMFSPWTKHLVPFWVAMAISTGVLGAGSLLVRWRDGEQLTPPRLRDVIVGVVSAPLLWGVFFCGHVALTTLFPASAAQVQNVYATKAQASPLVIALLLLFWIGPLEEVFWRGFVQQRLVRRMGDLRALVVTTALYTLVHIWAANPMLLIAAALCGFFWGLLLQRLRTTWPGVFSHAVWDTLMFVVLPLQ